MHRLRKKSDSSRPSPPSSLTPSSPDKNIPELPPASNFRTSLILPDLSRRFSVLRTPSGGPVSLDDLKHRLAEQRARGVPTQITEAEEVMILETLGRIRSKHVVSSSASRDDTNASGTDTGFESDYTPERSSHLSNTTTSTTYPASSITSSPSSRSTKRYSNNLFSSGRFREYSYLRTVSQRSGSQRSAASITHTESSQSLREETSLNSSEGVRPPTPEGSGATSSMTSSPNEKTPVARSASLLSSSNEDPLPPAMGSDSSGSRSETLVAASIQRASAALEQVIKEFEEEVEDEIVMPRTAHRVPRHTDADHARVGDDTRDLAGSGTSNQSTHLPSPTDYEAGTAISSDKQITIESDIQRLSPLPYGSRSGTTSPTPRLPGYIPGMPRPMTPHDPAFDSDDIRSHSTTPRAMSPMLPNHSGHPSLSSGLLRRGSDASRSTPRPSSPQSLPTASSYLSRSNSGRRTPDGSQRDSTSGTEQETSSVFLRRRPVSPLSGPAFQPMAVSPRPSTPSNVTWNVGPSASPEKHKSDIRPTHSRSGSLSTEEDLQTNMDVGRSKSLNRYPMPPDSPPPAQQTTSTNKWNRSASPAFTDYRAPSSLSSYDLGTPPYFSSRSFRSPTPTQSRTAASPTFLSDSNGATVRAPKQHLKSPSNHSFGVSQLSFTPLGNSSRSSLESTGSSYHSWDPTQTKQISLEVFNGGTDPSQPIWHDLDKSSSTTPGSSQEDGDFEEIIRRYAGLTKADFVAIQDKLVGAALQKAAFPDTRERTNSLRRRRPSTSQSNYSINGREYGVASPPPSQASPADRRSPDNSAKANALLESVVGSIPLANITTDSKVESSTEPEASPTTRRNRDLARALGFGNELDRLVVPTSLAQEGSSPTISPIVEAILPQEPSPVVEDAPPVKLPLAQPTPTLSPNPLPQRSQSMRNPRPTPMDEAELAKEVQRKVDAATAALMKGQKFSELNASTISVTRKRISPSQISTPRLLSAPTSVETIPLPQPMSPQQPVSPQTSLGITQRMRRFRNTLRAKPMVPSGDELTPFPIDLRPQTSRSSQQQPLTRRPTLPLPKFGPGSSTDLGKLKTPNSSPPTSTTPGLKGLMARFRKPRTENAGDSQSSVHSRASPTTSSPTASSHQGHTRGNTATSTSAPTPGLVPSAESSERPSVDATTVTSDADSAAVRQLFEAASNLGLDQAALNDLLARSTSVSRIGGWGMPGGSSAIIGSQAPTTAVRTGHNLDRNRPVTPSDKHPSDEALNGAGDKTVRKLSVRKLGESSQARQSRQTPENSAVIRRTLIFPSEFRASKVDLNQVTRKSSTRRHRRSGSATSAQSARSVHDRAPTPPPPKSNSGRRFSTDRSPPVPSVSTSITAQAQALLRAPPSNVSAEKSNSAYESLYDMYSGESKHTSTVVDDRGTEHGDGAAQEGPALEVVEMANGETIWSIVNGLRDDDVESVYASRTSLGSEYSTRENGDGLQIFVKEHTRSTSKGSTSSFLSRKKSSQGKNRPDTKVFYSSSAQIGRLIESLSQGMDAGSFNFIPNQPPDRSTPSSFHSDGETHWTVEERLEHMLGTIRNSNS